MNNNDRLLILVETTATGDVDNDAVTDSRLYSIISLPERFEHMRPTR